MANNLIWIKGNTTAIPFKWNKTPFKISSLSPFIYCKGEFKRLIFSKKLTKLYNKSGVYIVFISLVAYSQLFINLIFQ